MQPSQIGKKLFKLVKKNSHDFSPHYAKYEKDFMNWYHNFQGTKNEVRYDLGSSDGLDQIKLSMLLSDFTSIFPYDDENFLYTFDPKATARKILGSEEYIEEISSQLSHRSVLFPGYGSISEELLESTFEQMSILIEAGKAMIRPEKIIFVTDPETAAATVHLADPNGKADEWNVIIDGEQDSLQIIDNFNSTITDERRLSEILIPYIQNIKFEEYSKIILDEDDLISAFRKETKNYLNILKNDYQNSNEFKADVIQPKLDLINRKFKTITNSHRIKVSGATLGTIGLIAIGTTQVVLAAALSQFITFGLSTVGFAKTEADYHENVDKLKDIPEYLLWRINRGR